MVIGVIAVTTCIKTCSIPSTMLLSSYSAAIDNYRNNSALLSNAVDVKYLLHIYLTNRNTMLLSKEGTMSNLPSISTKNKMC